MYVRIERYALLIVYSFDKLTLIWTAPRLDFPRQFVTDYRFAAFL
jgi:hypothetical protein